MIAVMRQVVSTHSLSVRKAFLGTAAEFQPGERALRYPPVEHKILYAFKLEIIPSVRIHCALCLALEM